MTIPEAVRLVLQAGAIGDGGEVFLLDMGEPVRILDMANQMVELAGFTPDEIPIEFVGLRPGEKLCEELLRDEEGAEQSGVNGIFLAKLADVDPVAVRHFVAKLEAAADAVDGDAIRRVLGTVAGYKPEDGGVPEVATADAARGDALAVVG
jgi:FlaA1/EpsC-like NDP-sugar epimerase